MRIDARWIWTGEEPPFSGSVEIESGRIAAVQRSETLPDGPPRLLTMGLVNAHVHLDLTLPRPDEHLETPFREWLASVVETRRERGRAGLEQLARAGVHESIAAGTTLLFDYDPAGWSLPALSDSPIRRLILREVIALTPEAWIAGERGPTELESFLDGVTDPEREIRSLAPHAPYTVHPSRLPTLVGRADREGLPWSIHVAETAWERELLGSGRGEGAEFLSSWGVDPEEYAGLDSAVRRLDAAGLLSERTLLVHGNHLDEDEIERIARCGTAVVFCPRSHEYFGHPSHPFPRLLSAGIPVFLGTDGSISAGDLSILGEMRAARAAAPELSPETFWHAATRGPREFIAGRLGRGVMAPGEPADLALWSMAPRSMADPEDPLHSVLDGGRCLRTWIDGVEVHSAGELGR